MGGRGWKRLARVLVSGCLPRSWISFRARMSINPPPAPMDPDDLASRIRARLPASVSGPREEELPGSAPPRVPDHELLRKIGSGCYGEVWLAQSGMGKLRAVKAVWRHSFSSDRPYEREFRGIIGFEPLSRSHPGVISILHVGRDDACGCFFYVMELADAAPGTGDDPALWPIPPDPDHHSAAGIAEPPPPALLADYRPRSLRCDLQRRGRLPLVEVFTLGVHLADALGHLHRHGLVHRDVKPSNVVFVHGHPNLADIGLVVGSDEARSFVGTDGFIPPEGQGSARGDVFSLGRLLYEAATGRDRCDFPSLPVDLDGWPAGEREALLELNEVLAKMCAQDISQRHGNAAAVAGDLKLILAGRSVRRAYRVERRWKRATRISMVAITVITMAAGLLWMQRAQQREAEKQAVSERDLRQRAEAAEQASRQQLYTALLEQARANRLTGGLGHRVISLDAIRRASSISNTTELRLEALSALALPDLRLAREVPFKLEEQGRSFDPLFKRYAVCNGRGPIEIREVSGGRLLASLPAAVNLRAFVLVWSPDGRYVAVKRDHDSGGSRADLEVWDWAAQRLVLHAPGRVTQTALAFHPHHPWLMAGDDSGKVTVWNVETGRPQREFKIHGSPWSMRYSPEGDRIAISLQDGKAHRVEVRDALTGEVQFMQGGPAAYVAEWHPKGHLVAVPDMEGNVRLLNLITGGTVSLRRHKSQAVTAAFSPDGRYLISGGWEAELICWDLQTMQRAFTIGLNSWRLRFRSEGNQCAIELSDRIQIYDFLPPDGVRDLAAEPTRGCLYGAFSGDGRWFAANREDGFAVWDLNNPGPAVVIGHHHVRVPLFPPSGSELYAYWEGALTRWQLLPGEATKAPVIKSLPVSNPAGVLTASILGNDLVATGGGGVHFLPVGGPGESEVRHLVKPVGRTVISPDERWMAARALEDPGLTVFRMPEVEPAAFLTNHSSVWTCAFSPRGDELAVGTRTGLEFYGTTDWQRIRELAIPSERQSRILYAPDGRTFWHTSDGRTAALRDARSLEILLPLPAGTLPLALTADGRHLAVSVGTSLVQIWDLARTRQRLLELGVDWP